jgi:hypothetical protein
MTDSEWRFEIPCAGKQLTATFDGGQLSSDGGLILLQQVDERLGLTQRLAAAIRDGRDPALVRQPLVTLLRQRIFGIACGYEDCNDFDALRADALFKLAAGGQPLTGATLASQPTLSRLENAVGAQDLLRMSRALAELFVERHQAAPPARIILDADATDDPTHGQQELEFYHGYYDEHCYLPLLVYATADGGEQELVAAVLRPGNVHAGHRAVAVLRRIVERLRAAFPETEIVLRGDAGLALPEVYDYCEGAQLSYVISLAKNSRLLESAEPWMSEAAAIYAETGEKARRFGEFSYAAASWAHPRRVVVKAEVLAQGENPRFVVSNLREAHPEAIYDDLYIRRGDVENRIKELKGDLLSGRTSCHKFLANQFRLLLHAAAFVLMQELRRLLAGTELAAAQAGTLRVKLLKVGARIRQTWRRIWVQLPTSYPWQRLWELVLGKLAVGVT